MHNNNTKTRRKIYTPTTPGVLSVVSARDCTPQHTRADRQPGACSPHTTKLGFSGRQSMTPHIG